MEKEEKSHECIYETNLLNRYDIIAILVYYLVLSIISPQQIIIKPTLNKIKMWGSL